MVIFVGGSGSGEVDRIGGRIGRICFGIDVEGEGEGGISVFCLGIWVMVALFLELENVGGGVGLEGKDMSFIWVSCV